MKYCFTVAINLLRLAAQKTLNKITWLGMAGIKTIIIGKKTRSKRAGPCKSHIPCGVNLLVKNKFPKIYTWSVMLMRDRDTQHDTSYRQSICDPSPGVLEISWTEKITNEELLDRIKENENYGSVFNPEVIWCVLRHESSLETMIEGNSERYVDRGTDKGQKLLAESWRIWPKGRRELNIQFCLVMPPTTALIRLIIKNMLYFRIAEKNPLWK